MGIIEVRKIVAEAEREGLTDLDRAGYILDRGVSLDDYRQYERTLTALWMVIGGSTVWIVHQITSLL